MFSRRRRAVSNPPPNNGITNPTAALAASQAFLRSPTSNVSLSSAAAAAALRSHQSSPTPVGSVQTKRMQRRASVASNGSAATAPPMQRRMSNGSMTERTFRTPSPGRSGGNGVEAGASTPPVPEIPKNVSPLPKHKRATSAEPAPMRITSPSPRKQGGRGMSVDTGNRQTGVNRRNRASTLSQVVELDREGSQKSSINFSRPMSPRPTPPASPSPIKTSHSGWFTTPVVNDVKPRQDIDTVIPLAPKGPTTQASGLEQSIYSSANQSVKKKKKKVAPGVEGSHLAEGTMAAKPSGTAVERDVPAPARPVSPPPPKPTSDVPDSPQSSELSDSSSDLEAPAFQTRPPAVLVRQPSTVMEQPEAEETEDNLAMTTRGEAGESTERSAVTHVAPAKARVAELQKGKAAARPVRQSLTVGTDTTALRDADRSNGHERQGSLSPSRNAHFAAVAVEVPSGIKHQPPPRSISPAKSALKHSPSSSVRTSSPNALHAAKAPSDSGSDVGSDMKPISQKKKKGARVSFDESATREDESPSSMQSAGLESSRWSGRTLRGEEEDLDAIMKPRPALPSFGSVRRERRDRDEDVPQKVTETVQSSLSNSVSTVTEPLETSTDQVVGGVLAQDFASKKAGQEGLAIEVTPPEGDGEMSGSEYSADEQDLESSEKTGTNPVAPSLEGENARSANISKKRSRESLPKEHVDVPTIAVLPATPGTDGDTGEPLYEMPGAWSGDEGSADDSSLRETISQESRNTESPEASRQTAQSDSGHVPIESHISLDEYLESVQGEREDTDDDNSIYSDAAESLVELDEGGFASLNAIVESPVPPSPSVDTGTASPPESPLTIKSNRASREKQSEPPHDEEDWNKTKSHRSDPGAQKQARLEEKVKSRPLPPATTPHLEPAPVLKDAKPKKKKKAKVVPEPVATVPAIQQPAARKPSNQAAQPKKSALRNSIHAGRPEEPAEEEPRAVRMRTSLRDGPIREGGMRKSMRDGPVREGGMRTSMRTAPAPAPAGLAASRYAEGAVGARESKGALQKKNIPMPAQKTAQAPQPRRATNAVATAPQIVPVPPPALGRTLSNDSNASDSSFKRQRRSSASTRDTSRYTMRRSMRGSVPDAPIMRAQSPTVGPSRSSRLSIRSLSPNGSVFGRRRSIPFQEPPVPTLRSSQPPPAKSSRFSKSAKPTKGASAPRFKSRFADSDDEDDEGLSLPKFRSRFADSDDEDEEVELSAGLRPVRGIPRPAGQEDGDSTDLEEEEEESDDEAPAVPPVPSSKDVAKASAPPLVTNGVTDGSGTKLAKGSLRDSKYAADDHVPPLSPRKEKRSFFGLGKKRGSSVPPRPYTPTGASAVAFTNSPSTGTTSPRSPKLQRRNKQRDQGRDHAANDDWPLPSPVPADNPESNRPTTSDGAPDRPTLKKTRSTGGQSEPMLSTVLGDGKKKKFTRLRRVFGL